MSLTLIDKWVGTQPCKQPSMRQPLPQKLEAAAATKNSPSRQPSALLARGKGLRTGGNAKVTGLCLLSRRELSQMQMGTYT